MTDPTPRRFPVRFLVPLVLAVTVSVAAAPDPGPDPGDGPTSDELAYVVRVVEGSGYLARLGVENRDAWAANLGGAIKAHPHVEDNAPPTADDVSAILIAAWIGYTGAPGGTPTADELAYIVPRLARPASEGGEQSGEQGGDPGPLEFVAEGGEIAVDVNTGAEVEIPAGTPVFSVEGAQVEGVEVESVGVPTVDTSAELPPEPGGEQVEQPPAGDGEQV